MNGKCVSWRHSESAPENEIKNLYSPKKGTFKSITPKSLKEASDIFSPVLCSIWAE